MELSYRGQRYEMDATNIDSTESSLSGRYRGASVSFRIPQLPIQPASAVGLRYRGSSYLKLH